LEEKLNLTAPLDGWFGDFAVRLVKVGAHDAQIVHDDELPVGSRGLLTFVWQTIDVEITAEVQRTAGQRSGVKFVEENETLNKLVRDSAGELLRAQEANALGDRERNVIGGGTLTAASQGARLGRTFLIYELTDGKWKARKSDTADQPENGFAVLADESEEQIDLLCKAFEDGDEEARRVMKIIAQLSATAK
jgi:hypothetical protein